VHTTTFPPFTAPSSSTRVGQNCIYTPCTTVGMVIALLKISYVHSIYIKIYSFGQLYPLPISVACQPLCTTTQSTLPCFPSIPPRHPPSLLPFTDHGPTALPPPHHHTIRSHTFPIPPRHPPSLLPFTDHGPTAPAPPHHALTNIPYSSVTKLCFALPALQRNRDPPTFLH